MLIGRTSWGRATVVATVAAHATAVYDNRQTTANASRGVRNDTVEQTWAFPEDGTCYLAPQTESQPETQECCQICGSYRGTAGALRCRPGDVSIPTRIVVPLQVANKGKPGRQTRHFRTVNESPCQDADQTGLLLNLRSGGDILACLL